MNAERAKRKLSAILSADVKGYSRLTGEDGAAVRMNKELLSRWPNSLLGHRGLVLTYAAMGRWEEARSAALDLVRTNPNFSVQQWGRTNPAKDRAVIERDMELMRRAGLPD